MGAWRLKHVEWLCRNKTCTVLHQVGVSSDLEFLSLSFSIIADELLMHNCKVQTETTTRLDRNNATYINPAYTSDSFLKCESHNRFYYSWETNSASRMRNVQFGTPSVQGAIWYCNTPFPCWAQNPTVNVCATHLNCIALLVWRFRASGNGTPCRRVSKEYAASIIKGHTTQLQSPCTVWPFKTLNATWPSEISGTQQHRITSQKRKFSSLSPCAILLLYKCFESQ